MLFRSAVVAAVAVCARRSSMSVSEVVVTLRSREAATAGHTGRASPAANAAYVAGMAVDVSAGNAKEWCGQTKGLLTKSMVVMDAGTERTAGAAGHGRDGICRQSDIEVVDLSSTRSCS